MVLRFVLFLVLFLGAGASAAQESDAPDAPKAAASIAPLHSLLAGVMGEMPLLLIDPGQQPHRAQLAPSQIRALHNADILFYIGGGGEGFSNRLLHSLPLKKIAFSETIDVLSYRRPGFLRDKHDKHKDHDDDHKDDHDDHRGHNHDRHRSDIHIWLDVDRARLIVKQMAKALGETYPARRDSYQQNAARMDAKLLALDTELAAILKGAQNKPFAVAHDAYQYFERKYNLQQPVALRGGFARGLSARRLRAARMAIRKNDIRCVFREPQLPARHLQNLVENTDAVVKVADPLGANIPAGEEQYFMLMRQLAKSFADCLKP